MSSQKVIFDIRCPWFVHGCSMVPPSKTPKSMDKPWTNHGGTMEEPPIKPSLIDL
jgi:hypothetical protein